MKYTSAAAFRQALDQRLKNEAATSGLGVGRLRKRVAFELFLRRLLAVAPNRWVLKGALALDFRLAVTTRATKDIDLGREDDEQGAIHDITAAQQLVLDDFFTFAATRTDELDNADEFSAIRFHVTAQLAGRTFEQSSSILHLPTRSPGRRTTSRRQTCCPSPISNRSRFQPSPCRNILRRRCMPTRAHTGDPGSQAPGRRISSTSC